MNNKNPKLLFQGAEAKIYLKDSNATSIRGNKRSCDSESKEKLNVKKPQVSYVIKQRIPKSYRIQELDNKIRKQRTKAEAKILEKASKIINVPHVQNVSEFEIKMDFIDGKKLSDNLNSFSLEKQKEIMKKIGESVAKLHEQGIIHGDLTTSNMIFVEEKKSNNKSIKVEPTSKTNYTLTNQKRRNLLKAISKQINIDERSEEQFSSWEWGGGNSPDFQIFFIDFGLSFQNGKIEDKGIDIHLLKQALEAKHFKNWNVLFKEFEKDYLKINKKEAQKVLERLKSIEKRGRYKH